MRARFLTHLASVRFICGTQEERKQLEARIAGFLGMGDSLAVDDFEQGIAAMRAGDAGKAVLDWS